MHDALVLPSLFPAPGAVGRTELREPVPASTRDCQRRFGDLVEAWTPLRRHRTRSRPTVPPHPRTPAVGGNHIAVLP